MEGCPVKQVYCVVRRHVGYETYTLQICTTEEQLNHAIELNPHNWKVKVEVYRFAGPTLTGQLEQGTE